MIAAILAVIWASLNVVDLLETLYGLRNGHTEKNPVAAVVYDAFGEPGLIAFKVVAVGLILLTLHWVYQRRQLAVEFVLLAGVILMIGLVLHNARVLEIA